MKKVISIFVVVLMVFSSVQVFAGEAITQRLTYLSGKEAVFSVDFTDMWDVTLKEGKITGISKDGLVWFTTGYLEDEDNLEDAADKAKDKMEDRLTDIEETASRTSTINTMPAIILEGTAKEEGKDVLYLVVLVKAADGKIGAIAFLGDPLAKEVHSKDVSAMANSLLSA